MKRRRMVEQVYSVFFFGERKLVLNWSGPGQNWRGEDGIHEAFVQIQEKEG